MSKISPKSPIDGVYQIIRINRFDDLPRDLSNLPNKGKDWIFRGHQSATWELSTSFERAARRFGHPPGKDWWAMEAGLMRQFQRRAHHYLATPPSKKSWLEWLALMRHYGAPTRLLDWSYSYYVAAFFALERADGPCAVWAIDADWMAKRCERRLPAKEWKRWSDDKNMEQEGTFESLFLRSRTTKTSYAVAVNPMRLNERHSVQQGIFTFAGDLARTFEENLASLFDGVKLPSDRFRKYVLDFDLAERSEAILKLSRMNISSTSLYPGLDGYARSLQVALAWPEILDSFPEFAWKRGR